MKNELSVIIPAFNEEERIEDTVESAVAYFRGKRYKFEVLIVNDGSTDATLELCRDMEKRLGEVHVIDLGRNEGKGLAVKEGIAHARFAYCLFMDADHATSVTEWEKFESFFDSGARAVIASRHLPNSEIVNPQPFVRRQLGGVYRFLCRGMLGIGSSDVNCGFKAYETALAKRVFAAVKMKDWSFDAEVLARLKKEGVETIEVPVSWSHAGKRSNLAPVSAGLRTFRSLFALKKILKEDR